MAALEARDPAPETKPELSLTEKIVELYNSGKTYKQIATELDITYGIAADKIHQLLSDGVLNYRRLPKKKKATQPAVAGKDPHKQLSPDNIIPKSVGNNNPSIKTQARKTAVRDGQQIF